MTIPLPRDIELIISTLENRGYSAYAVGGCVRDCITGAVPHDWDICTSALPEQTETAFSGHKILKTGIRHGTVTLVLHNRPYEITTFRSDGPYSDSRRPDTVRFVRSLYEDLSRRDFTINAMAYNPREGVVDFFGGKEDAAHGIIRCVGDAAARFREDALRIIRALRFSSVLGFSIEEETARALLNNRHLLSNISAERINVEFSKILSGKNVRRVLEKYASVFAEIIPELRAAVFADNESEQLSDKWKITAASVENAPRETVPRLVILLSDTARDSAGIILRRLRYDNAAAARVSRLLIYQDAELRPDAVSVKRTLRQLHSSGFDDLLAVKYARANACGTQEELSVLNAVSAVYNRIVSGGECYSLKNLAVNGQDLIETGIPEGALIGKILNRLLDMVIDGEIENERDALLCAAAGL